VIGTALPKPPRGAGTRQKAAGKRTQAKADKVVYGAVDARDGLRCRVCGEYGGLDIQRHHIRMRSAGGPTTTGNVVSLCAGCHLVGVHGGRLRISGDADERGRYGRLCGLRVEQVTTGDVWQA